MQETRGWDEDKGKTFSQRAKESAHDYRYFPDPDLPKLRISELPELAPDVLKGELPELPWGRRERLQTSFGLQPTVTDMFVTQKELGDFFEEVIRDVPDEKIISLAANYISSDLAGMAEEGDAIGRVTAEGMRALMEMTAEGKLSSRGAKDALAIMYKKGGDPAQIAEEHGLLQESDTGALEKVAKKIIEENPTVVADYQRGKESALQFLIGQIMKATKGSANPEVAKDVIKNLLA